MGKVIKRYITNIKPSDMSSVIVFDTVAKPIVINDFIHIVMIHEGSLVNKGFNLNRIAEYSITAVEE